MTMQNDRSRLALTVAVMTLGGCAVGTAYVSAPDRLPSKDLAPLTRPISFDVCVARRAVLGHRIQGVLARAGVAAELTAVPGSPVDVTVTLRDDGPGWTVPSLILSAVTFSAIPGYVEERKTLSADFASPEAARVESPEHLELQSRTHYFIWLPLVISPDAFFAGPDGWISPEAEDGGFRRMVERLGDDLRARFGGDRAEAPMSRRGKVACPVPTVPAFY
jgi:hypothetical protein